MGENNGLSKKQAYQAKYPAFSVSNPCNQTGPQLVRVSRNETAGRVNGIL